MTSPPLPSFDVICRYAVTCSFLRPSLRQSFAEGLTAAAAIMSFLISPPKGLPLEGAGRENHCPVPPPIHNRGRGFLCWQDSILPDLIGSDQGFILKSSLKSYLLNTQLIPTRNSHGKSCEVCHIFPPGKGSSHSTFSSVNGSFLLFHLGKSTSRQNAAICKCYSHFAT